LITIFLSFKTYPSSLYTVVMATDVKTKICSKCGLSKSLTDYYKRANKQIANCKPCDNKRRMRYPINSGRIHKKRQSNFSKLSADTRSSILEDIKTMTIKAISTKYNINQSTIYSWKRRNIIAIQE
jgi:hypothetical protein